MATNRSLLRQCGRPCFSCCCCCCCSFCCFVFLCIHFMCCRCRCCCFCRGNAAQKQNIRQAVKTRQVRPVGGAGGAAPREGALEGSLLSAAHSWAPSTHCSILWHGHGHGAGIEIECKPHVAPLSPLNHSLLLLSFSPASSTTSSAI